MPKSKLPAQQNKKVLFDCSGHEKQQKFLRKVFSFDYLTGIFGGGIRSGKTSVGLITIILLAKKFPGSRWAIVRKDLPTIRRNTLPSFEKFRPENFVSDVNKSEWTSTCSNGSKIIFFPESVKHDPEYERWRGLEVNGFLLEEITELQRETYNKAIERAGSWIVDEGEQPPELILGTCNPANNWVFSDFYRPFINDELPENVFFIEATVFDNPYIPESYIENLKNLPEDDYKRFVEGDWTRQEDPYQLIKYEFLKTAKESVEPVQEKGKLGEDVGRYGDDPTVIAYIVNGMLEDLQQYDKTSIPQATQWLREYMMDVNVDAGRIGIDGVGLGAGVVDNMLAEGFDVVDIVAGAKPIDVEEMDVIHDTQKNLYKFQNLRGQMYWYLRECLRKGVVGINIQDRKQLQRLEEDLTAIHYEIDDKVIKVESKKQIRKRIGRSTDYADAFAMANFVHLLSNHRVAEVEVL